MASVSGRSASMASRRWARVSPMAWTSARAACLAASSTEAISWDRLSRSSCKACWRPWGVTKVSGPGSSRRRSASRVSSRLENSSMRPAGSVFPASMAVSSSALVAAMASARSALDTYWSGVGRAWRRASRSGASVARSASMVAAGSGLIAAMAASSSVRRAARSSAVGCVCGAGGGTSSVRRLSRRVSRVCSRRAVRASASGRSSNAWILPATPAVAVPRASRRAVSPARASGAGPGALVLAVVMSSSRASRSMGAAACAAGRALGLLAGGG